MELYRQNQVDLINSWENHGLITAAQAQEALTLPGGEAALGSRIDELREWIYSQAKPIQPTKAPFAGPTKQESERLRHELERLKRLKRSCFTEPEEFQRAYYGQIVAEPQPPSYVGFDQAVGAIQREAAAKAAPAVAQRLHEEHAESMQKIINAQNGAIALLRARVERMELSNKAGTRDLASMADAVLHQRYNDGPAEASPTAIVSSLCAEVRRLRGIIADMGARGGKRGAIVCCQNDEEDA